MNIENIKITKPPTWLKKRVVWNTTTNGGTAILLVGYCPNTLSCFLGLCEEVLKDIPDANINDTICSKVTYSNCIKGFTVILTPIPGTKRDIPGYTEYDSIDFNY